MIYTPDWESLARALERVASAHSDLVESKIAICNAVADKKIEVRVTIDRSHHRHSGTTFTGGNVDVPARLNPDDFDWTQSRPLRPWRVGPLPGQHYNWTGGWNPEPIELIELRRGDVTTVLRCDDKAGAEVIAYSEAKKHLCKAKFRDHYIAGFSGHEEYILEVGWSLEVGMAEWEATNAKAREFDYQQDWANGWLEGHGFIDGMVLQLGQPIPSFSRVGFEREFAKEFPASPQQELAPVATSAGMSTASQAPGGNVKRGRQSGKGSSARPPKGANVKRRKPRRKSAPKAEAIKMALRKHGYHLGQQGKSYKEIAKQIEPDVGGAFGATEHARVKAIERAMKSLKK